MSQIIANNVKTLLRYTHAMTNAQRAHVEMTLSIDPMFRASPDVAKKIAAAHGFPVAEPAPGLAAMIASVR